MMLCKLHDSDILLRTFLAVAISLSNGVSWHVEVLREEHVPQDGVQVDKNHG